MLKGFIYTVFSNYLESIHIYSNVALLFLILNITTGGLFKKRAKTNSKPW